MLLDPFRAVIIPSEQTPHFDSLIRPKTLGCDVPKVTSATHTPETVDSLLHESHNVTF